MENYTFISLILLLQVILDAFGDGFRVRGWQKLHHTMETIREAIWFSFFAAAIKFIYIDFEWYYIAMYILGRIWIFDLINNIICKRKLFYVGESSWDGVIIHWISGTYRTKNRWPVANLAFMIKLMAIVWWFAWLLTDGGII